MKQNNTKKTLGLLLLFSFLLIFIPCSHSMADEILPDSYSFDKATDTGSYNYSDWGGIQLTDGEYGTAPWSADLGNGPAYEWVGWVHDGVVNIDFDFGESVLIDTIEIGTVQDHVNDVVLPSFGIYSYDQGWILEEYLYVPESSNNNNQYFTFSFDSLGIDSQYIRISLTHSYNGPWTFVDEVDFFGSTQPVPEPATMLLLGSGLLGFIKKRKKINIAK